VLGRFQHEQRQARGGQVTGEDILLGDHAGEGRPDRGIGKQGFRFRSRSLRIAQPVLSIALRVGGIHPFFHQGAGPVRRALGFGLLGAGLAHAGLGFRGIERQ